MIIDVYKKQDNTYFKLNVCDVKTKQWASVFISEEKYQALKKLGVKVRVHQ